MTRQALTETPKPCAYSGLGLIADADIPNTRAFAARCTCGAIVTILDGRIPDHIEAGTAHADLRHS